VSKHTTYGWKAAYGGMDVSEAQEAKQSRDENTRLRKLVADLNLDKEALQSGDSKNRVELVALKEGNYRADEVRARSPADGENQAPQNCSRSWAHYRTDLGPEDGKISRFRSIRQAISYCGLCGGERSSAEESVRTPISKQRNKNIQFVLIEAAKLAPRQDHDLGLLYEREK